MAASLSPVYPSGLSTRGDGGVVVASSVKRGRWPAKPYVPVVTHNPHGPKFMRWTQQVPGLAFATPAEARASAQRYIDANYGAS